MYSCWASPTAFISIHALREEGDIGIIRIKTLCSDFYPRPPRGGRRQKPAICLPLTRFLSTPSARRATSGDFVLPWRPNISIHALREEGDRMPVSVACGSLLFLSTPSARRATQAEIVSYSSVPFLSTPSARRATICSVHVQASRMISIHALREEGDHRHSAGNCKKHEISIHALREEGDCHDPSASRWCAYFYPRPPRGGRRQRSAAGVCVLEFLSTPSARRATRAVRVLRLHLAISIHAIREEGDSSSKQP